MSWNMPAIMRRKLFSGKCFVATNADGIGRKAALLQKQEQKKADQK